MTKSGAKVAKYRDKGVNGLEKGVQIMNISAIKTTIQQPLRKLFPFAIGILALTSCTQPIGRIKDYCEEFDKSAVEYKECIDRCEGVYSPKDQAVLDSLVYRDLLNTTKLAKDSSAIAEFNRICATNKYSSNNSSNFEENLLKEGISAKEFNYIRSKNEPVARQFEADKVLFGKLFKEKGLMTEDFARKFLAVSKFVNPKMNYEAHEIKRIKKDILDGELINWGVSIEAKDERNVLNIKSVDRSGTQKDIVSIKVTNN